MEFSSILFILLFLLLVGINSFLIRQRRTLRNIVLLLFSYVFYAAWDYRFVLLLFISSLTDFSLGLLLGRTEKISLRKLYLGMSLVVNLGLLCVFKYFNFFIDSLNDLLNAFNLSLPFYINVVLPVGISFYTFQTLSYTIDVYKGKYKATNDFVAFFAYVSFFPQLMSGPIERADFLLPQFNGVKKVSVHDIEIAIRFFVIGLFKKTVIANNLSSHVHTVFSIPEEYSGGYLLFMMFCTVVYIYCDFSGYSDMAVGLARALGFKLHLNFMFPIFSTNVIEFWSRWHTTLMRWFKDYVFLPLGGGSRKLSKFIPALLLNFFLIGLWHGAGYKYPVWSILCGLMCLPLYVRSLNRRVRRKKMNNIEKIRKIVFTQLCLMMLLPLFQAETIGDAMKYYSTIIANMSLHISYGMNYKALVLVILAMSIDVLLYRSGMTRGFKKSISGIEYNSVLTMALVIMIIYLGNNANIGYIYYQF